jgi:hypothetical protein
MITFGEAKKQLSGAWATSVLILNKIPPFYWDVWDEKVLKPEEMNANTYDHLVFIDATKRIGHPFPDGDKIMKFTSVAAYADIAPGTQIVVGWQITKEEGIAITE